MASVDGKKLSVKDASPLWERCRQKLIRVIKNTHDTYVCKKIIYFYESRE